MFLIPAALTATFTRLGRYNSDHFDAHNEGQLNLSAQLIMLSSNTHKEVNGYWPSVDNRTLLTILNDKCEDAARYKDKKSFGGKTNTSSTTCVSRGSYFFLSNFPLYDISFLIALTCCSSHIPYSSVLYL